MTDGSGASPTVLRGDWVNQNQQGETANQFAAIGCAAIFFTYLVHQLGFTYTQICSALLTMPQFSTLAALYHKLANDATDPFPTFVGLLNSHFPQGTNVAETFMNPWPLS
jgi:hypothetical protein